MVLPVLQSTRKDCRQDSEDYLNSGHRSYIIIVSFGSHLIISRETLGPTRRTGSHKQAARGPGDALSNSLAGPYQIVFMASSIVQTMDWRD